MGWFSDLFKKKKFSLKMEDLPNRVFVHTLGDCDPRALVMPRLIEKGWHDEYSVFSGVDVRVYFDDKPIGILQGISFGYIDPDRVPRGGIADGNVGGTCSFILFDGNDQVQWLGKEVHLALTAANEYGKKATIYNAKIRFDEHEQFGISIDDIVTEVRLDFTVLERYFTDYVPPESKLWRILFCQQVK